MTMCEGRTLTIGVKRCGEDSCLYKPSCAASQDYEIREGNGHPILYVGRERNVFPLILMFLADEPIFSGIGFADPAENTSLWCHTELGPCGGCFSLCRAVPPDGSNSLFVLNEGDDLVDGYDFLIYFKSGNPLDPQIYNHGDPDQGPWWKKLLRLLWRRKSYTNSPQGIS
jgi:hypothetical protein